MAAYRGGLLLDAELCDLAGHLALDVAHHGLQLRVGLVGEGDAPAEEVDAGRPNPVIGDARLAAQPPVGAELDANARARHRRPGRGFALQHAADVVRTRSEEGRVGEEGVETG